MIDKIWTQNVRDSDFQVIYAAENSNNFHKTRFWKEKSVEDVVTLGPPAYPEIVFYYAKEELGLIPPPPFPAHP